MALLTTSLYVFSALLFLSFISILSLNVLPRHLGSSFSVELSEFVISLISVSSLVFNSVLLLHCQKEKDGLPGVLLQSLTAG